MLIKEKGFIRFVYPESENKDITPDSGVPGDGQKPVPVSGAQGEVHWQDWHESSQ